MKLRFFLTPDLISRQGQASLVGQVNEELEQQGKLWADLKTLILVFPQTDMRWREKHGPLDFIIMEYNVPCLIESILWIRQQGISVQVDMETYYFPKQEQ